MEYGNVAGWDIPSFLPQTPILASSAVQLNHGDSDRL